jgi:integrase
MASLYKDGASYRVAFSLDDPNERKRICLPGLTRAQADEVRGIVGKLVQAKLNNVPAPEVVERWLVDISNDLHSKLAGHGLVTPRGQEARPTLKQFLARFFETLPVKASTAVTYKQCQANLFEYFGEDADMAGIGAAEADQWRLWLVKGKLAEATISRRVKHARQFWHKAIKWGIVKDNPFNDLKAGAQANEQRAFYITPEMTVKVLAACPNAEWKVLFALSRWCGLRCPSEHFALKWGDVDFEHKRIKVTSAKTEHFAGRGWRFVPLFPEIEPLLLQLLSEAPEGSEYVILRYRDPKQNLRTQLQRIIIRAGLEAWPRLFHNLRASCQTDLSNRFPAHVVCKWLGNTLAVAGAHYLQTTDAHFEAAVAPRPDGPDSHGAFPGAQGTKTTRKEAQNAMAENAKTPEKQVFSGVSQDIGMTPTGFEPVSRP